jgi:hypothetical protein
VIGEHLVVFTQALGRGPVSAGTVERLGADGGVELSFKGVEVGGGEGAKAHGNWGTKEEGRGTTDDRRPLANE